MKRIIVYGTDGYCDVKYAHLALAQFLHSSKEFNGLEPFLMVYSDRNAALGNMVRNLGLAIGPAAWEGYNARSAPTLRQRLLNLPHVCGAIVFWDGKSRGTKTMIDMIEKKGIPFAVHMI